MTDLAKGAGERSRLRAEVDAELDRVRSGDDLPNDDEPQAGAYASRLHSLHDAVVALEGSRMISEASQALSPPWFPDAG